MDDLFIMSIKIESCPTNSYTKIKLQKLQINNLC